MSDQRIGDRALLKEMRAKRSDVFMRISPARRRAMRFRLGSGCDRHLIKQQPISNRTRLIFFP